MKPSSQLSAFELTSLWWFDDAIRASHGTRLWNFGNRPGECCHLNWLLPLTQGKGIQYTHINNHQPCNQPLQACIEPTHLWLACMVGSVCLSAITGATFNGASSQCFVLLFVPEKIAACTYGMDFPTLRSCRLFAWCDAKVLLANSHRREEAQHF